MKMNQNKTTTVNYRCQKFEEEHKLSVSARGTKEYLKCQIHLTNEMDFDLTNENKRNPQECVSKGIPQ